jgi:glucan 1,3-beta-glucosidase
MNARAYLRLPALLLLAVAACIFLVWYALGLPVELPRSALATGERLDCVSYAPIPPGTAESSAISPQQIEADVAHIAKHARCIHIDSGRAGLDFVPEAAARHGLTVLLAIPLGADAERNNIEIDRALELVYARRDAIGAIVVGSEVLTRGDMTARELRAILLRVRAAADALVTYADRPSAWLNAEALVPHVDFITLQLDFYAAENPPAANDAVTQAMAVKNRVAGELPSKTLMIGNAGWPSAGRMREGAYPSRANQARLVREMHTAANAGGFRVNFIEAFDENWRGQPAGTAAAHMGLFSREPDAAPFGRDGTISNHPLWRVQASIGVLLALVVFAAAFLAGRSAGPAGAADAPWPPIAGIALAGGLFVGWAVADVPTQSYSLADWLHGICLIALAFAVPPVTAAALVRRVPLQSFSAIADPLRRRQFSGLSQALALLFMLTVLLAVQLAFTLVFDPEGRDFAFAELTGPAAALLIATYFTPRGARSESHAEAAAALLLAASAIFIVFSESFLNWQAVWFAAALLTLAWTCWRAPGVQRRG